MTGEQPRTAPSFGFGGVVDFFSFFVAPEYYCSLPALAILCGIWLLKKRFQ